MSSSVVDSRVHGDDLGGHELGDGHLGDTAVFGEAAHDIALGDDAVDLRIARRHDEGANTELGESRDHVADRCVGRDRCNLATF